MWEKIRREQYSKKEERIRREWKDGQQHKMQQTSIKINLVKKLKFWVWFLLLILEMIITIDHYILSKLREDQEDER